MAHPLLRRIDHERDAPAARPVTRSGHFGKADEIGVERNAGVGRSRRAAEAATAATLARWTALATLLRTRRAELASLASQLELLNPQRTLERGYAIVTDAKGHVLRAPGQIRVGHAIGVRLAEGSAEVGVASVQDLLE